MPGQLFNFSRYFKKQDPSASAPGNQPSQNTPVASDGSVVEEHTTMTTTSSGATSTGPMQPYSGIGYTAGGGQPYSGIGYPASGGVTSVPAQQTVVSQSTASIPQPQVPKSTTNQPQLAQSLAKAPAASGAANPTSGATSAMQKRVGMDVLTRLTQRSNQALMAGVAKAKQLHVQYIDTEHVLYGLLSDSAVYQIVSELKASPKEVQDYLEKSLKPGKFAGPPQFSPRVKRVLELALSAARSLGYEFISPEHILLALAQEGEGMAAQVMSKYGLTVEALNKKITGKKEGLEKEDEEKKHESTLEQFAEDLTQKARDGKLDPVVARSAEIERIVHILSRRTKNNPVLIGDAGVGKTAIVEGLAQRVAVGDVPETLLNRRILQLDLMSLIAGARHRGEFEERLKNLIKEVKASAGQIILFIDEIHNMVGAGSGGEGTMDASNILKPSLARGELQTIGTTTITEYRKYIEKDPALERRFQPVLVPEPTLDQAIEMLRAIRDKYEAFHKVSIPDKAIESAVRLSQRYVGDRFLPDKAVDLIDEAASAVRLPAISLPEEIKSIQAHLTRLDSEKKEAEKVGDTVRLATLGRDIEELNKELEEKKQAYETKKSTTTNVVSEQVIEEIVSRWTNIPISKLTESESTKLLKLEDVLHKRLIDQEEAVAAVAEAVRRGRAGLKNVKRPIGSFVFMGPTGVGKTELAKTLAETLFGSEDMMVRLDMTEYMEKHEVAKLIGAPPGYVGYEEGGQLTEAVRRHPYAVVLFDEIEKAHPDVFNILIQLLDDGRLTDNKGHTVSFKNTIVICTSNLGTGIIQQEMVEESKKGSSLLRALDTYTISPTGREMITLNNRIWEHDAGGVNQGKEPKAKTITQENNELVAGEETGGSSWKTRLLSDYFAGTTVNNQDDFGDEGKLPVDGFDTQVIAPSGEENITHGGQYWTRKSTIAKEWTTDTLIAFFKDHMVVNALPDQPEQQMPTARIDTSAITPDESQVISFADRFWQRANLTNKDWTTGMLADYLKDDVVVGQQKLDHKTANNSAKEISTQDQEGKTPAKEVPTPEDDLGKASAILRDPKLQLPIKAWDVHLFSPHKEEIIIAGDRYWKRAAKDDKEWTTGTLAEFFQSAAVTNANPEKQEEQLPTGQALKQAKQENQAKADEKFAEMANKLMEELRKFFRPELLNRFDEIIVFRPLTSEHMLAIVDLQLKTLAQLLEEQTIGFEVTDVGKQQLEILGYDPIYGARPLRRTIQREVENAISSLLIEGKVQAGDTIRVDFDGNEFVFDILAMGSLKKTAEIGKVTRQSYHCSNCGTTFETEVVPNSTVICNHCASSSVVVMTQEPEKPVAEAASSVNVTTPPDVQSEQKPLDQEYPPVETPTQTPPPPIPPSPTESPQPISPPSLSSYFTEQGLPQGQQPSVSTTTSQSSPASPTTH